MIVLDKNKRFDDFMKDVNIEFCLGDVLKTLGEIRLRDDFSAEYYMETKKGLKFYECCLNIINMAVSKVKGGFFEEKNISNELTTISKFLSFTSKENAEKYLTQTPYIEENFMFNLLEYTFYAIVLIDSTIYRRFKTSYTLWQHSVDFGIAGFSEKFNKFYPYYLTYFGNKIFIVDPIRGEVRGFEKTGSLREKKITGLLTGTIEEKRVALAATAEGVYVPLVEENLYGTTKEVQPTHLAQSDRKQSERSRKREQGFQVEETPWLTTALDVIEGSAYNIRSHSFIALMVYGLEVMKYGIMDSNSIFTIDHIDGTHNNNKISNLQLLTRKANDQKKFYPNAFYFNYFDYWENQVKQAKINQSNFNFRKIIEQKPLTFPL